MSLEGFFVGCILAVGVLVMLSIAVLVRKRDYKPVFRYGMALFSGIAWAEIARSLPDSPRLLHLVRKLSLIPLAIAIAIALPLVRRAWSRLRGESSVAS